MAKSNATADDAGTDRLNSGFWDWALKRAPKPARFLLGGYLLLAVAGLVLACRISLRSLIFTAVVVLLSSVVVALLVSALQRRRAQGPATFLLWAIVLLIVAVFALFVSSAFAGWPRAGALILANLMDLPELVMRDGTPESVTTGTWPGSATEPLDVSGTEVERVKALTERPSLKVFATKPLGGGTVYVNVLDIVGESIVTNGQSLTIEANKIRSSGGAIRAFQSDRKKVSDGPGATGGSVTLIVHDRIVGLLTVDLSGQAGADGKDGGPGRPGPNGAQGNNAASSAFDCSHGPGGGQNGGAGGPGEDGRRGESGGNGGTLTLAGHDPDQLRKSIAFGAQGGKGGAGGKGGPGGPGGAGGAGGSSNGWCHGTGPHGADGLPGSPGNPGSQGQTGAGGSLVVLKTNSRGEID
jgi:hypothetical protein